MNIESEMKRIEDYRELRRNTDYPNFSIFYEPKVYYFGIVLSQVFDTLAKQFDSHHLCLKFLYWLSFTNQFQCNFYATVWLFKKKKCCAMQILKLSIHLSYFLILMKNNNLYLFDLAYLINIDNNTRFFQRLYKLISFLININLKIIIKICVFD